jgi:hypothetical protein
MPYFPDTSVLGPGALTGALTGAVALSFSGPAVSQSVDDVTDVATAYFSGGANIQNNTAQVGFAQYLNFDGSALGNVAIANNTATITINAGAAGATFPVLQTGTLVNASIAALNFIGLTGTITVASSTASIGLSSGGGAATPGGPANSIQFSGSGAVLTGSNLVKVDASGNLNLASSISGGWNPLTPSADTLTLFSRRRAGRNLLNIVGPAGVDVALQPNMFLNKITYHAASDNSTTVTSWGSPAPATTGTAVAGAQATTNFSSTLARLNYANPAGPAGTTAGWGSPTAQYWLGSRAGEGGFYMVTRCILAGSGTAAERRWFCGFQTGTAFAATSPGNQDPTSVRNCFGVAKTATGTNYIFTSTDTNGNNTSVDSGITYNSQDVVEVRIFAKPSATQVNMSLEILSVGGSGAAGGGPLAEYTTSGNLTNMPSNTTLLAWRTYMQNTGTTSGNRFGIMSVYTERDY